MRFVHASSAHSYEKCKEAKRVLCAELMTYRKLGKWLILRLAA